MPRGLILFAASIAALAPIWVYAEGGTVTVAHWGLAALGLGVWAWHLRDEGQI